MEQSTPKQFVLGEASIDQSHNQITLAGTCQTIEPQAMATLCYLASKQGEVVSSEELLSNLWPGKVVSENTLHRIIRLLRKALNDNPSNPKYIKTVPKKGYCIVAPITRPKKNPSTTFIATLGLGCTLILFSLILWLWPTTTPSSLAFITAPEQLSSLNGREEHVAYWPEQHKILLTNQKPNDDFNNLFIKDLTTGSYEQLTYDNHWYDEPIFSPSGDLLLYTFHANNKCTLNAAPVKQSVIAFEQAKAIANCHFGSYINTVFSPDGEFAFYRCKHKNQQGNRLCRWTLNDNLTEFIAEPPFSSDAKRSPRFYHDLAPIPTHNAIAYLRTVQSMQEIRVFNVDTRVDKRILRTENRSMFELDWSPVHQALVVREATGAFLIDIDGKRQAISSPHAEYLNNAANITITPTNQVITTQHQSKWKIDAYRLTHLTNEKRLSLSTETLPNYSGSEWHASYSPDGKKLIYLSNNENSHGKIWLQFGQIHQQLPITDYWQNRHIHWSPNTDEILYVTVNDELKSYNLVTKTQKVRLTANKNVGRGIWSVNPNRIYFTALVDDKMQIFQTENNVITQLTNLGGNYLAESKDGKELFFNRANEQGLWKMSLATGNVSLALPEFHPTVNPKWQLAANGIYHAVNNKGETGLFYTDFATKTEQTLAKNKAFGFFSITDNEQKIVITTAESNEGDLYISHLQE